MYIPWLTETIKKRGVRYLLHHYLGQFFEEKLTLEQLSIDIYEGKGSIRNLNLDVDGLNDELDFIPFTFLDGCLIGQISVEVPWSSLVTDACRVELDGAKFFCRLKTSSDAAKHHCTESTLLSRSLMTSSMQMAEEIVTTEDDDDIDSIHAHSHVSGESNSSRQDAANDKKKKDASQMFEGLEMFAQLIDSVLRRTKLTARNTLFQIQPHNENEFDDNERPRNLSDQSPDEFSEPTAKSDTDDECHHVPDSDRRQAESTVEFFIKFFRCEEMIDQTRAEGNLDSPTETDGANKSLSAIPETVTKLLTLEDVEMRIDGVPVSNLIGKHTISIKFNGQKSEISIFSGSPLLAVISHKQLETFFNVFDSSKVQDLDESFIVERNQKLMSSEDYAKIENQLLESASFRNVLPTDLRVGGSGNSFGKRWAPEGIRAYSDGQGVRDSEYDINSYGPLGSEHSQPPSEGTLEPTLDHIEAFSCELKLPGIWLCILRAGEALPPLIKPYADSINSFQTIGKYIDKHIKVPHIRCLALKVALNITAAGTNVFLGDLDISEHLEDSSRMSSVLKLVRTDQSTSAPVSSSRYRASIKNGKDVTIELLTRTRIMFDPTIIDRIVYDYKLIKLNSTQQQQQPATLARKHCTASQSTLKRGQSTDLNLTLKGDQFKVELLCPIPDLTRDAHKRRTQLRPQSFIFDFKDLVLAWQSDKLRISSSQLLAYVKTQPMQSDTETVKFIESSGKGSDKITLELEPSPSNLDNDFSHDIEQALNESAMCESIYVGQANESRLPTDPFQTKRKVVRASFQNNQQTSNKPPGSRVSECDHEKILTPGDRQHLLDYLEQTLMATKLSLKLHLPICEVEFEDKEQLDLIYNRFGNDFVFWQPRALTKVSDPSNKCADDNIQFRQPHELSDDEDEEDVDLGESSSVLSDRHDTQNSRHSMGHEAASSQSEQYENEVTCKITVDELVVRFNHQSCAAALKQEIGAENFLLGVIIDVNKRPNTLLSIVADNLELSTDLNTVVQGNYFGDKNSVFALTAEIQRPTKLLKNIKLAIQLKSGLFNDFRSETYKRFWQSINVTDEPILGYVAPQIVTELHVDILNTSLVLVREDARPALLSIDELYMTSMVMEQTSQVMIRLIADEVSLYMKRDRQGLEIMKNYICLIDSGLIDLDVKFGQDDRLEFGVINNVITVRVCQDSLSALCKLFNVLIRNNSASNQQKAPATDKQSGTVEDDANPMGHRARVTMRKTSRPGRRRKSSASSGVASQFGSSSEARRKREMNLMADAMNDDSITTRSADIRTKGPSSVHEHGAHDDAARDGDYGEDKDGSRSDRHSGDEDQDDEEDSENEGYESDSDAPPVFQRANSTSSSSHSSSSSSSNDGQSPTLPGKCNRDPNACLLDESNPLLGDMLSQPLLPSSGGKLSDHSDSADLDGVAVSPVDGAGSVASSHKGGDCDGDSDDDDGDETNRRTAMDESGFFVIGDDDVGAGIIDKKQHEPVVRKLIDGPISIVENHFKMTKPRTIPEMLATSLERYVLEEMTLVVNLFGGHDFDDNDDAATTEDTASEFDHASEATNELLDTLGAETSQLMMRSRAGSMANTRRPLSGDLSSPSSLKQRPAGRLGGRRKHLSEGGDGAGSMWAEPGGARASEPSAQRVRFGEGALNLWESLDLMSSPDFLGARARPKQPPLNSDLKQAGGTWRENDVCIQLTLSKIKLLYEVADGTATVASPAPIVKSAGPPDGRTTTRAFNQPPVSHTNSGVEPNSTPPISWRFMLFIQDIEVKDRIAASDINKMLYEYCTEAMPKRSTQMLAIKNVATINLSDGCEECDLRVSLKPLRLNIDQDTLLFLIEFCTTFCKALAKQRQNQQPQAPPTSAAAPVQPQPHTPQQQGIRVDDGRRGRNNDAPTATATHTAAASTVSESEEGDGHEDDDEDDDEYWESSEDLEAGDDDGHNLNTTPVAPVASDGGDDESENDGTKTTSRQALPTHCHTDELSGPANHQPIYIKSFTFSPDVPIRIDYHAKHLDFEQGALAGILMGLAHLDHSELILRRVQAKHGMRGLDRVLLFAINSWLSDIKRNQLPSILGGVGPMHSVIQLFQGMRDLVWMPIDHYRKDGRLVRGLQRGASSFSSSTAMAAINLVNRFISIVQCTAQIAHDIVTPPPMLGQQSARRLKAAGGGSGGQSSSSPGLSASSSARRAQRRHHHHHGRRIHSSVQDGVSSAHGLSGLSGPSGAGNGGLSQPRNFCEGVAVGFSILKEGFNDTARNVTVGMQAEDMRSAVGELVRQIPSTLLNPIISATEGAQSVLVGIRNQIAPDARREDQEKWKGRVRGK